MAAITIIGAGMMGSAMSVPARDNGHQVRLVGTHLDREIIQTLRKDSIHPKMKRKLPDGIEFFQIEQADAALAGANLVICGVSSFGIDWFADEMLRILPHGVPLLAVTKGLALLPDQSVRTFPEVFEQTAKPGCSVNAIGGPCTSYELCDRHQTHVAFCGKNQTVLRKLRDLLQTKYYHISLTDDVLGVEAAVALKNAYALGVSLAIGLAEQAGGENGAPHYNSQAALFGQSVREMEKLVLFLGGRRESVSFGVGDLYVTIFGGRTRLLGTMLGRGRTFGQAMEALSGVTLESVAITSRIAAAVRALSDQEKLAAGDFPLLFHIHEIIEKGRTVEIPWERFAKGEG